MFIVGELVRLWMARARLCLVVCRHTHETQYTIALVIHILVTTLEYGWKRSVGDTCTDADGCYYRK